MSLQRFHFDRFRPSGCECVRTSRSFVPSFEQREARSSSRLSVAATMKVHPTEDIYVSFVEVNDQYGELHRTLQLIRLLQFARVRTPLKEAPWNSFQAVYTRRLRELRPSHLAVERNHLSSRSVEVDPDFLWVLAVCRGPSLV